MKTYSRKKGDSPSNVIIHVNELCRLCLAKEEEMVPIYDDETIPLSLRIMACVNLEVSTNVQPYWFRHIVELEEHRSPVLPSYIESLSKNRNLVYLFARGSLSPSFDFPSPLPLPWSTVRACEASLTHPTHVHGKRSSVTSRVTRDTLHKATTGCTELSTLCSRYVDATFFFHYRNLDEAYRYVTVRLPYEFIEICNIRLWPSNYNIATLCLANEPSTFFSVYSLAAIV